MRQPWKQAVDVLSHLKNAPPRGDFFGEETEPADDAASVASEDFNFLDELEDDGDDVEVLFLGELRREPVRAFGLPAVGLPRLGESRRRGLSGCEAASASASDCNFWY